MLVFRTYQKSQEYRCFDSVRTVVANLQTLFFFSVISLVHIDVSYSSSNGPSKWDMIIVGTLDGKLHGLEAIDGTVKWTLDTGGSLVRALS